MTLEYVILGHDINDQGEERRKLLLFNGALPSLDPAFYTRLIDIEPMLDETGAGQTGLALVEYDGPQMLLVVNQPAPDNSSAFTDHYVFFPLEVLTDSADQFVPWLAYLPKASPDLDVTLPLLRQPTFSAATVQSRTAHLAALLDQLPENNFEHLMSLLGALIDSRQLVISDFPLDLKQRLAFIAGLQALLPGSLASQLTFASNPPLKSARKPQIVIADAYAVDDSWDYSWRDKQIISGALEHPYIEVLKLLWSGDVAALALDIQRMTAPFLPLGQPGELEGGLRHLAERFWVDHHVKTGADVSTDVMIEILEGAESPSKNLRRLYIEKLLRNALNKRDSRAGRWVAAELERDSELEASFTGLFEEMLEDQPDAVYVFIRNRLINLGVDERWIPRLHQAARNSLEVAIDEGDVGTLAGWLELIAHEPLAYQLHDILRDAILAAARRAYTDGELALQLILIATRRVPEIVAALYADEALIAALDSDVRAAFQNPTADTIDVLIDDNPEHFLLALYNGINASDGLLVSLASMRHLIALAESETRANLPAAYRAPALVRLLATRACHQVDADAVDVLLGYILHIDDRKFMADALNHIADCELLFPRLVSALRQDNLPLDKIHSVLNAASAAPSAAPQAVIDSYFSLLGHYDWQPQTQRLIESLARLIAKHHQVQVSYHLLWTLLEACHVLQLEAPMRVAMSQLMAQLEDEEDLNVVVEGMVRISQQIVFSDALQGAANDWWRDYTHSCSIIQLQRLQRELRAQRHMEDQKHILTTVLAMRRWLHSRGPAELAEAINSAYLMLEHITEAFDSGHLTETDPHTIRREVDGVSRELSSEEQHILANNLRNLANRITQMAENRSKPSLMRSDDSIDRQLLHGEANPQGSIDMLKWIAGYLDGAHPKSGE